MKNLEINWLEKLTKRNNIIIFCLVILLLLFNTTIKEFYDEMVVTKILSHIDSNWITDIAVLSIAVFSLLISINLVLKIKRIANSFFSGVIVLMAIFSYLRITERYDYQRFYLFPDFKYVDVIFLLGGLFLAVKIWGWINYNREPFYYNSPFLIDKPIDETKEDKFGRKEFAKKIAIKIQSKANQENVGALAIGINGEWGSGKTSFMNMIKGQIESTDRIIIDFNPWRSSSATKIIEDYFELLIDEMKPYDANLASTISNYAKTLTTLDENIFTKATDTIIQLLAEDVNKNQIYESINSSLIKIRKQLLIFVDDLDRLDTKEIIEVFRLIRNTANFTNVVYVVTYDKEYVYNALKEFNSYNYRQFLEKIFQFEFSLPLYDHSVIRNEIKTLLKANIDNRYHKQIDRAVDSKEYFGINFTNKIIINHRDAIRLVNSLLFEIELVKEDVFFYDFYLIQLLKLKVPNIYEALVDYQQNFFKVNKNGLYDLNFDIESNNEDNSLIPLLNTNERSNNDKEKISVLKLYLDTSIDILSSSKFEKDIIFKLIHTLINKKATGTTLNNNDLGKSFAYPSNFNKYFALRLYEGDIPSKDFEDFRRRSYDEYKKTVLEWINNKKYEALIDKLNRVYFFATVPEFENHFKILFEIGRTIHTDEFKNQYWFDDTIIFKCLSYPEKQKELRVYNNIEDYHSFLRIFFKTVSQPPIFESNLIAKLISKETSTPLSIDEFSEINFEYFKVYCKTHDQITLEFRLLYNNSITRRDTFTTEIIPEAKSLFIEYFQRNLTGSGLAGFIKPNFPEDGSFYLDKKWISEVFNDLEDFDKYLKENSKIKNEKVHFDEFVQFYSQYKENRETVTFYNFKFISPQKFS